MRMKHILVSALVLMGAWLTPCAPAAADTVLLDSAGFIQGQQSFVQSFDITTAGTLTVTLSSVPWLDTISDLTAFISTANSVIGSPMSAGTDTFNVQPGMIYAHWFGDANGAYNLGVYGLQITFQPQCTTVPLPTGIVLLLSGLAVLLGWPRRRPLEPQSLDDKALTIQ